MVIRIASVVLSFAGLLALILGLLFWINSALNLIQMHMLLGLLAVGALWVIGIGRTQSSLMVGAFHWVIQVIHLVLGLLVIGMGHMGAARYRKSTTSELLSRSISALQSRNIQLCNIR